MTKWHFLYFNESSYVIVPLVIETLIAWLDKFRIPLPTRADQLTQLLAT